MTDLALTWTDSGADLTIANGGLAQDDGLRTAVIISLFTDRQASIDDPLPDTGGRRGFWAESVSPGGDPLGSRLWLLAREKTTPGTLTRAREYCLEALDWLMTDGVASAVEVTTRYNSATAMIITVEITHPDGQHTTFNHLWTGV